MTRADYDDFDLIVCMDQRNIRNALRITDGDPEHKIVLLLDYAGRPGEEVADPWYTGDFDATWDDVVSGCEGLLRSFGMTAGQG
jgi:protein-tyrosine phosphatase